MNLDDLRAQATIEEGRFRAFTHMAVELEVAELLYALVRQTKPNLVVECGAGEGYSSAFIAQALVDNGQGGRLFAFEQDDEYVEKAKARLVHPPTAVVRGLSHERDIDLEPDLVFIDTLGNYREQDMAYWFAHPGRPLIVIHDAAHYPPETFAAGEGVLLGSGRGVWIGRARA